MIVTIKTANRNQLNVGICEAFRYGLEIEPYVDNTFDLTVHDMDKANRVATSCKGKIISIVDRVQFMY